MKKPHFMRIDKDLKKELMEIKERGKKASLSDVIREMVEDSEREVKRK